MKLGFFTMPMHPPGRDYTQTLKEDREAVLLADRLGYTEAYIGEHIADRCETIPSCLSFIASLAHETRTIRLGSGTDKYRWLLVWPTEGPSDGGNQVALSELKPYS